MHVIVWGMDRVVVLIDQGGVVLVVIIWEGGDAKERVVDLQISDPQRLASLYHIDSPLTMHPDKKMAAKQTR